MRLFAAVNPDQAALNSLAEVTEELRCANAEPDSGLLNYHNLRWIKPDLWHVTLVFFDEISESRLPRLMHLLSDGVPQFSALTLQISGLTVFPQHGRPRMLWAGLAGDLEQLSVLARAIRRVAHGMKIPVEERAYQPHITLGRWRPRDAQQARQAEPVPERFISYVGPLFVVNNVVLMKSNLGPRPEYEALASWPLGAE